MLIIPLAINIYNNISYQIFRCAQKIVTQLETVPLLGKTSRNYKYEKLPQTDDAEDNSYDGDGIKEREKRWWTADRRWSERNKSEERIDNKKNELAEKQMELKEKHVGFRIKGTDAKGIKEIANKAV